MNASLHVSAVRRTAARVILFGLTLAVAAGVQGQQCELVSVRLPGPAVAEIAFAPSVNGNGRFVAFSSWGSNLVPDDTNGTSDVFVRDRLLGVTERVSVSAAGEQGNGWTESPAISQDGRFVAFQSRASTLVADDTNGHSDIFVRDRLLGTTERVSVGPDGRQSDGVSTAASISAEGRFVAFDSLAANLVPEDGNGTWDVFVHDRETGVTQRVSVGDSNQEGDGASEWPKISADGRYVAFESRAANLVADDTNGSSDVFVRDRQSGYTRRVSVASDGSQADGGSFRSDISGNGRFVAFWSLASNLTQTGDGFPHVYRHDRLSGSTMMLPSHTEVTWVLARSSLSGDGRHVAYEETWWEPGEIGQPPEIASRVVVYDSLQQRELDGHWGVRSPALSADGRWVASCDFWPGIEVGICALRPMAPPDTEMISGPCGEATCSPTVAMAWMGTGADAAALTYAWRVDAGQWSGWTTDTFVTLAALTAGQHLFEVKAKDLSGNEDPTPAQCSFTVDAAPPTLSIRAPANGAAVEGVVNISANASDASVIQRVEFYARGQLLCTDMAAPYSCEWDTRPLSVAEGPAEICARALDSCGHSSEACVTVTVDNATFDDVPKTSSWWHSVEALAAAGITSGCSANPPLFCPNGNITRAQLAKFVCLAAGKTWLDKATPTFADVPKGHPFYGWIERLTDPHSWGGTPPAAGCEFIPARKFCPGGAVTREYLAMVLCLATGKQPMPSCSGTFADVGTYWACPYVERLADAASWPGGVAVTSGCAINPPRYCPKSPATRGQMAVFLVRAFGIPF